MDPATASIHPPPPNPPDPARYIYEQAHFALNHPQEHPWSASNQPPTAPYLSDQSGAPTALIANSAKPQKPYPSTSRVTRTRAAAIARQASTHDQPHQIPQPYPDQQHPQPYPHAGYLNEDPQVSLHESPAAPYSTPGQPGSTVYPYPPTFASDRPHSPSPTGSPPNHPPSHPPSVQHPYAPGMPHTPLAGVYPASIGNGYPPPMLLSTRVGDYPIDDGTVYGASTMTIGTDIMRVPSASPSVASHDLGSPAPEDLATKNGHSSTRSSSNPHSLDHYDYTASGPISPLSASYAPQALPSSLTSVAGGYLHGPPASSMPSAASFGSQDSDSLPIPHSPSAPTSSRGRPGQKSKTKLTDMDRKFICVFAQNHPKARQEDIATKFAVERSTVSKILKCKEKWMKVDFFSSEARVVKHRPSKFPELEERLIHLIRLRIAEREPVNDAFIKKTALELAAEKGIGKDKFKASSGWVENFKHRHDLRKGAAWDKNGSAAWSAPRYTRGGTAEAIGSNGSGSVDEHGAIDPDADYHDVAQFTMPIPAAYLHTGSEGVISE